MARELTADLSKEDYQRLKAEEFRRSHDFLQRERFYKNLIEKYERRVAQSRRLARSGRAVRKKIAAREDSLAQLGSLMGKFYKVKCTLSNKSMGIKVALAENLETLGKMRSLNSDRFLQLQMERGNWRERVSQLERAYEALP